MAAPAQTVRAQFRSTRPTKAAAVCYRRTRSSVEFLLVNTASGRWTFPKGNVEPGLSTRESAALEALEEAGVMGKVSSENLDSYLHPKNDECDILVADYLLEVHKTVVPFESHRNPTWFTPSEAKLRLAGRRSSKYKREFDRVINIAVAILSAQQRRRFS